MEVSPAFAQSDATAIMFTFSEHLWQRKGSLHYMLIRGIADYKDGAMRKEWQQYAGLMDASVYKSSHKIQSSRNLHATENVIYLWGIN